MEILLALITKYVDDIFISMENKQNQLSFQHHIVPATTFVNLAVKLQNSTTSIVLPTFQASAAIFLLTNNATRFTEGIRKLLAGNKQISFILFVIWTGSHSDFPSFSHQMASQFTLDSDVFVINENSARELMMWEAYSIKGEPFVLQTPFNIDDANLASKLAASKYTSARRRNFHRISVVATATDDPSYYEEVKFSEDSNGAKFLEDGIAVDMYRIFRDYLNFSEGFIEGAYMLEEPLETERMQVYLNNGQADLCITMNIVDEEKIEFVRFLHPLAASWLDIRFKEPATLSTFLLQPFEWNLWKTIAVYAILIFVIISFVQWTISKMENCVDPDNPSLYCNILYVLSTFCIQGWYRWPSYSALKIIMLVATVVGLMLNAAYSGILTAQLAVKKPSTVTIEKLLDRKVQFCLEEDVSFPIDLQEFPQWRDVRVFPVFENEPKVLKAVIEGHKAWVMFPEYYHSVAEMANYSDQEACELTSAVRASSRPSLSAMAVNKTSELKEVFNHLTLKLLEQGVLRRLWKKYKGKRVLKCVSDQRHLQSPTLLDLALAFAIVYIGIFSSLLALSFEVITQKCTTKSLITRGIRFVCTTESLRLTCQITAVISSIAKFLKNI